MCNNVKVSVIIPVYNVELYLRECLETVVNQTLKEIEIIIINDGSTDNSGEIIKKYEKEYSNIVSITQENHGLGNARNRGLNCAKGQFIYFMDSDDKIEIDMLEQLYTMAIEQNLEMILFDADVFSDDPECKTLLHNFNYKRNAQYPDIMSGIECLTAMLKNGDYKTSVCLRLFRKDLIDTLQIRFIENIIHEDEWFAFKTLMECQRVRHIDKNYFHRRVRCNSIMTSRTAEKSFLGYYITHKKLNEEYKHTTLLEKSNVILTYEKALAKSIFFNYTAMEKEMRIKYRDIWNSIIEVNNTLHLYEGFLLNLGIKHPELYVKLKWIYHKIRRK